MVKRKTNINALVFALVMLLAFLLGTRGAFPVYAEDIELEFDKTDAVADLTGSEINGKTFNVADYAFDSKGKTTVLTFIEYSYAFREADQDNYGLYVYVHNPLAKQYIDDVTRNTVELGIGEHPESYEVYPLRLLNNSSGANKGLFYKYKVVFTEPQKTSILHRLNSAERVYSVSDINLVVSGEINAEPVTIAKTFKYMGYAAGCGFDKNDASTLSCYNEYLDVVSLECHATTYRPKGTNGKNDYTQSSLHSVYFTLPHDFVTVYGKMVGAKGRYLNAVLKPFLITGVQSVFDTFSSYLGKSVKDGSDTKNSLFAIGAFSHSSGETLGLPGSTWYGGYSYNVDDSYFKRTKFGSSIDTLYMIFNSGDATDSADNYIVSSSEIAQQLKNGADNYGGELVQNKYPRCMFESIDNDFTYFDVRTGDTRPGYEDTLHDLKSYETDRSWWDKLWGLKGTISDKSEPFTGIKAIEQVTDFPESAEEVAERYFISKSDYEDFKVMRNNAARNGDDMYVLRYQVSDFVSQEATFFERYQYLSSFKYRTNTNGYFVQETVNLDFEIIDITMYNGSYHVIPVSMAPIDVIPEATPPVYTKSDKTWWEQNPWLTWVLTGIAIIILLIVLMPILPTVFTAIIKLIGYIIKGIVWVVALPFRCIKLIIDKIKEKRETGK